MRGETRYERREEERDKQYERRGETRYERREEEREAV